MSIAKILGPEDSLRMLYLRASGLEMQMENTPFPLSGFGSGNLVEEELKRVRQIFPQVGGKEASGRRRRRTGFAHPCSVPRGLSPFVWEIQQEVTHPTHVLLPRGPGKTVIDCEDGGKLEAKVLCFPLPAGLPRRPSEPERCV